MAREFAQIKLSVWADDDWRDLSAMARYLYLTLLTSPTLNHCGVADWRPSRIAALNGMGVEEVESAGDELISALYLVVDRESEEVLIRSFIRNDGLMKQPKMAVAMASAHAAVASRDIRGVLVHELKRLREDFPDLSGWGSEKATHLLGLRSVDPSTFPLGKGSGKGIGTPFGKGSPTPAPTPTTTPADSSLSPGAADAAEGEPPDRFDEFWDTYSHKVGRKPAEKAYRAALKKPGVTADLLVASAAAYITWQHSNGKHPQFTKHAATWLAQECWRDERPVAAPPQTNFQSHIALVRELAEQEQAQPFQIGPAS